jgi:hypothetical protein
MTKLLALLPILLLVCVVFVSGCTSQQEKPAQNQSTPETNISNISVGNQTIEPVSELIILSGGEVTKDSFGNEYAIGAYGEAGIDLTFNSQRIYLGTGYMGCKDGMVKVYDFANSSTNCAYVGNVKIYLRAADWYARKATIEVIKI